MSDLDSELLSLRVRLAALEEQKRIQLKLVLNQGPLRAAGLFVTIIA
jgi:hypothetical protein